MATSPVPVDAAIQAALVSGDLSKLAPEGRVAFYNQVCDSLGLNPLTQPFAYIVLNGKLQLYAKKDCTDQLRNIHSISVKKLEKERIEDVYAVTAYVENPKGRQDSSIGAVNIGNQKGDALANLLMKAETKAKRRATLSICGMGILDESELETIPEVKHFKEVEEVPLPQPKLVPPPPEKPIIEQSHVVTKEKPTPTLIQQLEASLAQEPPADEYAFNVVGDRVTCKPVDVIDKTTKGGKPYVFVKLDGEVESLGSAFCYSHHLFDALRLCKDKVLVFTGETRKNFLYVADVVSVDGHEYREGKPIAETTEPLPITADDIPF